MLRFNHQNETSTEIKENKMNQEIKTAISKAMTKLVGFSLNDKAMNGNSVQVALHGEFRHDIWVSTPSTNFEIIESPKSMNDIQDFEAKIEKIMAEIKAMFHTPAEVLSTLKTEANE